jgi:twitching motility protein PilT
VQLATTLQGVITQQLLPATDNKTRVVVPEVLVATSAVRNLIREGKGHQIYSVMQAGGRYGMRTMDASLAELVKMGKLTEQTALEHCHDADEFQRLLRSDFRTPAMPPMGPMSGGLNTPMAQPMQGGTRA